jgi:stearoyl-CoA desaturase (Delta-9 desaturase)
MWSSDAWTSYGGEAPAVKWSPIVLRGGRTVRSRSRADEAALSSVQVKLDHGQGRLASHFTVGDAGAVPFWAVHVVALVGVCWLGWSWTGFALAMASYYFRMFFVTAGLHRYFAHRAYKTSRAFQLVLAIGGMSSAQRSVLWWAANHRLHHKYSDQPKDIHSPVQRGLWWAHVGWCLSPGQESTRWEYVRDLSEYPELRWLDRHDRAPALLYALALLVVGGVWALVWGFLVSTALLWHGTFTINSLAHRFGSTRYQTNDNSRNNLALAILTMGEGWHNNHHHFQSSARQGFYWWEIDVTYYILCLLARVGIVRELREPPRISQ